MGARVIVYTGKGGVGKTSVAAATALACAERGIRTLVLSTDIAHSLGDVFDGPIGGEPVEVARDLWAQEADVYESIQRHWGQIQRYFADVFAWRGLDPIVADEMSILPGVDELACLLRIIDHVDSGEFQVIVVDAAPTGETVRLLSLPEAARWWLERVLPIQRRAVELAGPMLRRITGMPMPDDSVFKAGEDLFRKIDRMHQILSDPASASVRIVLNLERMVIAEAKRAFTYFHLFGYATDLVVCNRVLTDDSGDYFASMRASQRAHLDEATESFAPVPVHTVPFFGSEVVGFDALRSVGRALFAGADPAQFFYQGRPYRIERQDGAYVLRLELPFSEDADIQVLRNGDELVVQVGPWRRNLVLPHTLAGLRDGAVDFEGGVLRIRFTSEPERVTEKA